jgi:thiol-disulfide isomerase/thioredoxin
MKMRAVIALLAVAAPLLLITGCDWFDEQPAENLPPATEIIYCPPSEVDEGEDLLFRYIGSDVDGRVIAYEWSFNNSPWIRTEEDSAVIEAVDEGEHPFVVRSIDDKGDFDPLPPRCGFTALPVGEVVDRTVLVELFTTRTCANCPKAEEALLNLVQSMGRANLSVIAYHDWRAGDPASDPLGTEETVARIRWYTDDPTFPGRAGLWPTAVFDGLRVVEGAETVEQAESNYSIEIGLREPVGSPLRLTVSGGLEAAGGSVRADVKVTGRLPAGALVLRAVVVEDHVLQYTSYYEFVARRVLEDEPLDLVAIGDSTAATWAFPVDGSWNLGKLDVVVFVQNDAGREVIQSERLIEQ